VKQISLLFLLTIAVAGLSGCYQIHSDDDLRTIPVTNNPTIVPNQGRILPSAPMWNDDESCSHWFNSNCSLL